MEFSVKFVSRLFSEQISNLPIRDFILNKKNGGGLKLNKDKLIL